MEVLELDELPVNLLKDEWSSNIDFNGSLV